MGFGDFGRESESSKREQGIDKSRGGKGHGLAALRATWEGRWLALVPQRSRARLPPGTELPPAATPAGVSRHGAVGRHRHSATAAL